LVYWGKPSNPCKNGKSVPANAQAWKAPGKHMETGHQTDDDDDDELNAITEYG